jgi:dTDP-4-amino-4,6-dideoxygalactose transaminase
MAVSSLNVNNRMTDQSSRVPLADPALDTAQDHDAILAAVAQVVGSGAYILGPQVTAFESAMANRHGVRDAVGVGSGTDALILALKALNVGPGDEVVTVSHTAGPTVAAICALGATPVLIDIDADTYNLDAAKLDAACGTKTKAVIAVHLYGCPADIVAIRAVTDARGVPLIEDCAQAQEASIDGKLVGSFGSLSCFSFYPTKNLGAIGDGGMVLGNDAALLKRVRQLRTYGWTNPQFAELPGGVCSRLDEIQAAVLAVKLRGLAASIDKRRALAQRYSDAFRDLPLDLPADRHGSRHAFHLYVVRTTQRDGLMAALGAASITTGLHYPFPVHKQPAFATVSRVPEPLAVTEKIQSEILTLPLFPSMSGAQQARVISAVRDFFGEA